MKYILKIPKLYLYVFLISFLFSQENSFKYNLFPPTPELKEIYIEEGEEVFTLIMEFSGANFDYVTNETFAPPSLNLLFKNVLWKKGNFSNKSDNSPLYQYSLQNHSHSYG